MKPIIIQKYGGSSVADIEKIKKVAEKVIDTKKQGYNVLVVVSAMGNMTNELVAEAEKITFPKSIPPREGDMLFSIGERKSIAFLAMAINSIYKEESAMSLTGSQCGIITDCRHTNAQILEVRPDRILHAFENDKIVIVAGYQGVSVNKEITTLGRGGSDLTAIALSIALEAERCEIYTDVDGVYNSNPRDNKNADKFDTLSPAEVVEMSASGAKVLDINAAKLWQKYAGEGTELKISKSSGNSIGTIITTKNISENKISSINISNVIMVHLSEEKRKIFFDNLQEVNLMPMLIIKLKNSKDWEMLFECEKSEVIINSLKDYFDASNKDFSLIAADGKNIGVDINVVSDWEMFFFESNPYYITYNANKIFTVIEREKLDIVKEKIFEYFL